MTEETPKPQSKGDFSAFGCAIVIALCIIAATLESKGLTEGLNLAAIIVLVAGVCLLIGAIIKNMAERPVVKPLLKILYLSLITISNKVGGTVGNLVSALSSPLRKFSQETKERVADIDDLLEHKAYKLEFSLTGKKKKHGQSLEQVLDEEASEAAIIDERRSQSAHN